MKPMGIDLRSDPDAAAPPRTDGERGVALFAMIAVLLPLLVVIGSAATTMVGRGKGAIAAMGQERAFLAAESGIDEAVYRARVSLLSPGATFANELGDGARFDATTVQWAHDGLDNDGDGSVDEADEAIIEVRVVGTYRGVRKNLSARFVYATSAPLSIPSPIYFEPNEKAKMKLKGNKDDDGILVSGFDKNLDGSRPAIPYDVPPFTVASEIVLDKLMKKLTSKGSQWVEGVGLIEVRDTNLDIDGISEFAIANPDLDILAKQKLFAHPYGDSSVGDYKITHVTGKLEVKDDFSGAGVLIVDGELKASGDFRFDGLVVVRGKLELKKSSDINGAIVVRGKKLSKSTGLWEKAEAKLAGDTTVQYSSQALRNAANLLPPALLPGGAGGTTVLVTGWTPNYARSQTIDYVPR